MGKIPRTNTVPATDAATEPQEFYEYFVSSHFYNSDMESDRI